MKIFKILLISLFALTLTGCYTQLQYSQKVSKTGDHHRAQKKVYHKNHDRSAYQDNYIPLYYRDYSVNKYYYGDWYGYDWYDYDYYRPFTSYHFSPYYRYHPWEWKHSYRSSFWIGFSWGYHYDPFYYDSFWYGSHPWAHRSIYYGNFGYSYYYGTKKWKGKRITNKSSVRYGPRSVGTYRVSDRSTDARSRNSASSSAVRNSASEVRSRSVGVSRLNNTTVRSRSNSIGTNRSREQLQQRRVKQNPAGNNSSVRSRVNNDRRQTGTVRNRAVSSSSYRSVNNNFDDLRSKRATVKSSSQKEKQPNFFDRVRKTIKSSAPLIMGNKGSTRTIRSRARSSSSGSKSRVTRSRSRTKSPVIKQKSSSSNSRARRTSPSRSRSRGDDSSSSRSRGNN